MTHDLERDRGGISKDDRRHLLGRTNSTESTKRDVRKRTRERIHNLLLDFPILVEHLDADVRKQALIGNTQDNKPPEEIHEAIIDAVAFIYLCYTDHTTEELDGHGFKEIILSGIERGAEVRRQDILDLDLTLEITDEPIKATFEKYEAGQDLTASEIRALQKAGKIEEGHLFAQTPYTEMDKDETYARDAKLDAMERD